MMQWKIKHLLDVQKILSSISEIAFCMLSSDDVIRHPLVQKIIETSIKYKLVITSRDVLNFIYDAVVPHEFDEKAFWKTFNYPSRFLGVTR